MKTVLKGVAKGKVQGVWFRRFVQQQAQQCSVTGYAENLDDGSVEVLLIGNAEAVRTVQQKVAEGPPDALVSEVEWKELSLTALSEVPTDFDVR